MKYNYADDAIEVKVKAKGFSKSLEKQLRLSIRNVVDQAYEELNQSFTIASDEEDPEEADEEDLESEKDRAAREGYNFLKKSEKGLHHQETEYTPPEKKVDFGVKIKEDGKKLYQLFYICPQCKNKGKRFVPNGAKYTNCHECNKRMAVDYATDKGVGYQDEFSNFFIAGDFQRNFNAVKTLAGTFYN